MSRYFGAPWPSGICEDEGATQVPTPVGESCWYCHTLIEAEHQGSFIYGPDGPEPQHKECSLRSAVGGIYHVRGECQYTGHCEELREQAGLSLREDALQAWAYVHTHGLGKMSVHG